MIECPNTSEGDAAFWGLTPAQTVRYHDRLSTLHRRRSNELWGRSAQLWGRSARLMKWAFIVLLTGQLFGFACYVIAATLS